MQKNFSDGRCRIWPQLPRSRVQLAPYHLFLSSRRGSSQRGGSKWPLRINCRQCSSLWEDGEEPSSADLPPHVAGALSELGASALPWGRTSSAPDQVHAKFISIASAAREGSPEDKQLGLPVATVRSSMNRYHPL